MNDLALTSTADSIPARLFTGTTPALFAESPRAEKRFWEFFTATIRNPNTGSLI